MRTLIDLPQDELEIVDEVVKKLAISRAEFVRRAISVALTPYRHKMNHASFGSWSEKAGEVDGLAYQEKLRAEW